MNWKIKEHLDYIYRAPAEPDSCIELVLLHCSSMSYDVVYIVVYTICYIYFTICSGQCLHPATATERVVMFAFVSMRVCASRAGVNVLMHICLHNNTYRCTYRHATHDSRQLNVAIY